MTSLPRLYPILDTATLYRRNCSLLSAARAMLDGGAQILQIRHKEHWSREVFEEAEEVRELCGKHGTTLVVNDRADIALLLDAGLHVGQDDLPAAQARKLIGNRLLGLSTHSPEQLTKGAREPVDYLALGPVFSTSSKLNPDREFGPDQFGRWRKTVSKPLVAIGGITRAKSGGLNADSLAVIGDLIPDPCTESGIRERMEEWQRLLGT